MIRTIIHRQYWTILQLFYRNRNTPLHLREISRKINLKESATSRHLQALEQKGVLRSYSEANLKKYALKKIVIPELFGFFDIEKLNLLPLLRKNAIDFYINSLSAKPVFVILFGSSAKGTFREDSDVDVIAIFNRKTDTREAIHYTEAQTGLRISEFQLTYAQFTKELKMQQDKVIQAGIETGYPVYNQVYYHKVRHNG